MGVILTTYFTNWSHDMVLQVILFHVICNNPIFGHHWIISKGHQNGDVKAEYFVDGYEAWWMIIKQSYFPNEGVNILEHY